MKCRRLDYNPKYFSAGEPVSLRLPEPKPTGDAVDKVDPTLDSGAVKEPTELSFGLTIAGFVNGLSRSINEAEAGLNSTLSTLGYKVPQSRYLVLTNSFVS
jgi:hypothetical protein